MSFEFLFASQVKTFGVGSWSLLKKKKIPSKIQSFRGENAAAFPSKFCIFKGRFVLQEAAFGSHLRRRSFFFFCLTNQPFCAVWVQWRVTWNLQESYFKPLVFVPNVYQAKTWQGGGWGWVTVVHLAAPGLALMIQNSELCQVQSSCLFQSQITSGGEMRLPNMSLLLSARFLLESVMELHFFTSPFKILCALKKNYLTPSWNFCICC